MTKHNALNIESCGDMMIFRMKGMIAQMASIRGTITDQAIEALGSSDISVRTLAEIAFDLDFHIDFNFTPIEREVDAG